LAKHISRHLSRRLNIFGLLLFALVISLLAVSAGAEEPPGPSSDSVWYAAGTSLVRVDAESGNAAGSLPLSSQTSPVSSLASHPTDGSVSVLAKGRLLGFDTSGNKTFEAPVAAASSLGMAPVLASGPHDGSLWVGGSGVIVLADARGQNQRTVKLNTGEVVKAISASQGGGAYALTQSRLLRYSKAGEMISQRPMSTGGVKSPTYLAVDEYGGLGYVANTTTIAQVSLGKPGEPPIRKIKPNRGVAALSVNPFDGILYVASRPSRETGTANLYAYDDGNGLLLKKVSLKARAIKKLSFDTPSQTLWLGTDAKVLGFQRDLSQKAQIAASGLNTLSAAPLSLTSRVSLLEPQDGATTTDPKQPITLGVKAFCNSEMCPAGFGYGSKLAFKATLNGQDVSDQFKITGDAGSASGAEANYTPASGLPEGENSLVAEAVDAFGGRSNHLEATFSVDTTAPSFLEVKPEDGSILSEQTATITGRVDDPNARVYLEGLEDLGGKVISSDPGGFSFEVPLKEGDNSFRLLAYDEADNLGEYPLKLVRKMPLALTITEPEQGSTVNTDKITVKGTVEGPAGTTVRVGEVEASVDPQGNFVAEAVALSEGPNSIVVEAIAPNGESIQEMLELTYEPPQEPLALTITEPEEASTVNTDKITVQGTVTGPIGTTVRVGEVEASVDPQGNYVAENVPLEVGSNTIVVKATAPNGESVEETLEVTYELTEGPLALTITEPEQESTVNTDRITVKGTVEGPAGTTVRVGELEASVDSQGNFVAEGVQLSEGTNEILVEATTPRGESVQKVLLVTYHEVIVNPDDPPDTEPPVDPSDPTVRSERPPNSPLPDPGPLPPDPEQVAPPVEEGVTTDMADSASFLYEGENPVQTGVEPETIQDKRVAVLKGKVINRLGEPVPGVRITVLDHPEYGETLTREDGEFDLAVNGGGTIKLVYEKDRYMPAQRQVDAPWRDFAVAEDVVLVGFSRRVTDVDLAGTEEMLVAQGSSITDVDGTRQSTVLLPGNTQAEMVMPDGTKQPLPQLEFRATEYTVGEGGPEAMPAPLPPTSGYTYAVELSADEAVEAGAEEVRFTEPVYNYVEDFLGFPVGTHVPSGYYDQEQGAWMGSNNGRVIKILSIKDGLAELDVDGNGNPADAAALENLGITDEERMKLASLYTEGQVLWRVPVEHLTPWDFNFPYGPPDDAMKPDLPLPPSPEPEHKPNIKCGSVIECENQILAESLEVSGAPFSLHYGSDRVPGYKAWRNLDIPVSGSSLPPNLKGIELEISVAGQTFKKTFPSTTNQSYRFTWDGKDAYGRTITGEQDVRYRLGYTYPLAYQEPSASFGKSWAAAGENFSASRSSMEVTLWQYGQGKVASWQARDQGIGGWTPDILHQYDPETETVLLGDGDRYTDKSNSSIAKTFAGNNGELKGPIGVAAGPDGSVYIADWDDSRVRQVRPDGTMTTVAGRGFFGYSGDGGPANQAALNGPIGVAVGPDGSLYIADTGNHRIRRVGPNGIITTVAGNGKFLCPNPIIPNIGCRFSGDGGPATQAQLYEPNDIAVAPDGSLYIADTTNARIRRVGPDGIITTVAGNGFCCFGGNGGSATKANLRVPRGVAVAPDGSIYIADSHNHLIRRVGPDGIITTVAGRRDVPEHIPGYAGDGGPAVQAKLANPNGIDVGPDGSIYIGDSANNRIRRVGPDGIITTVAGFGTPAFAGDGGPARNAAFNRPWGVTVGPDGSLYIADTGNDRIRQVEAPSLPRFAPGEILVPAEDGSELYVFDTKGKHLRTLDATTGTVLYSFSYDEKGRLTVVEDVDGLETTVERDTSGNATAIVAPNGERTELALDANGYLASVSNPAGETTKLAYDDSGNGLLQSLADPKNNTTRFSYDALGRLTKDEDPAGGFKTLSRTEQAGGDFTTSLTTASGRKDTYDVDNLPDGSSRRTSTDPSGLKTETFIGADGTRKLVTPDGTTMEETLGPDPRFGMQAPVANKVTVKTPGGLSTTTTTSRQATFAEPGNPLSATRLTDTVTTNGKVWTSTWDKAAGTEKSISPEGRSTTTTVDAKGRPVLEESVGFAPTSYEYDERGRLTKETIGTGTEARTTTYAYDEKDRLTSITDPLGKERRFEYDAAGRVVREIGPGSQAVSYSYDENGNLTSITPPGQPAHEFGYDSRNLPTSYNAPQVGSEDRTTGYGYDLDHLPTSLTLPSGGKIEYSYDAGGRLQTLRYPGGEKTYTYDAKTGNPATASNASGTLSYSFDGFLPLSETSTGQVPGKVQFSYDNDLRVKGVSVNGGPEVAYSYDKDGLITKAGALDVSRDPTRGLLTGTTLSNVTDKRIFNSFGEMQSYEALSGTTRLYESTYKQDSLGRIVEKTENIGGESTTYAYAYDEAGNLKEVKKGGSVVASYAYDANGNRLSHTTPSGTTEGSYDAQDRLTSYGGNEYAYTPDGQLMSKTDTATGESTSYNFDALGNLLSVTLPDDKKVEYVVDARGRRVGKKVDGQLVQGFLYQNQLAPAAELDGAGGVVSRFVYATKENVPDYMEKGGKTYRIFSDHLGSVRLVVDASTGEVAQRLDYDEFGRVLNDTNPGFQPFGFAGGLYDSDTKLTRFGARDYDAETGRWTAKDPLLFLGGQANLFSYALNDPVNRRDANGLCSASERQRSIEELDRLIKKRNERILKLYREVHKGDKTPMFVPDANLPPFLDVLSKVSDAKDAYSWIEPFNEMAEAARRAPEEVKSEMRREQEAKEAVKQLQELTSVLNSLGLYWPGQEPPPMGGK
jgi:RHS repeat-associated protein